MKLIKNWKELSKIPPNNKYRIIIKDCCGWIVPICDIPNNHDYICCCDNDKTICKDGIFGRLDITFEELQAINKQVEELHWNDTIVNIDVKLDGKKVMEAMRGENNA